MGLKFVVSEAQTRSTKASQASSQAQQAAAALQQSIQTFLSAPLSSKAYDSAKNYFMVAYTPICQSIIMTGEALANAHKKFLSEYLATVNGSDLDEDQLVAEIDTYKALLDTIDDLIRDAKTHRTDLERRSMNAYQAMQKRQEKLEKFRTYSGQSASYFSDYQSSQSELNNGLAQVQECKAWNASTGTFDIARLDMNWAKPINERWKNREVAKAKQKEEAFNNNLKKLEGYTIYAWPYEDPVTGGVTVSWFIDKDGQRLDNSELQNFLEMYGKDLDPSYYQVVDWQKIQNLENAALRRGETYITGQKYEGLSKGATQLNGYISTGYAFAQQSGLYDLAMMAGLSYAASKAKVSTPKKTSGANQKVLKEITNPVLEVPRSGSGLKVDDIKPVKGKGSVYDIDPLTGKPSTKQTQIIIDEFPNVPKAHGFSDIIDNYAGLAEITDLGNAKLYQIQGSQNGVMGRFEWIIQDGKVSHRMFVRNPELNGVPIK